MVFTKRIGLVCISNREKKYKNSLTGIGGTIVAGRWNFARYPIIYTSEHPATARLEILGIFG